MELTTTKEAILKAFKDNPSSREMLKELFPEAFTIRFKPNMVEKNDKIMGLVNNLSVKTGINIGILQELSKDFEGKSVCGYDVKLTADEMRYHGFVIFQDCVVYRTESGSTIIVPIQ